MLHRKISPANLWAQAARPVRSHVNLFESDFTRRIFVQQIEELHGRNFTIKVWAERGARDFHHIGKKEEAP